MAGLAKWTAAALHPNTGPRGQQKAEVVNRG